MRVPYSLVNVPALGYDLVRLPHGEQAARVLRAALHCGPAELAALASGHPGRARTERWQNVLAGAGRRRASTLGLAGQALAGQRSAGQDAGQNTGQDTGLDTGERLLHRLERAAIGDLASLERVLRHDFLDWTWSRDDDVVRQRPDDVRASDVLADAAASAYCSELLDPRLRRAMAAPFLAARLVEPTTTGLPAVDELLAVVVAGGESARHTWR
ncbi:MAG: hypothetical protein WB441_03435, partial [Nocardioidaceae bacterium]